MSNSGLCFVGCVFYFLLLCFSGIAVITRGFGTFDLSQKQRSSQPQSRTTTSPFNNSLEKKYTDTPKPFRPKTSKTSYSINSSTITNLEIECAKLNLNIDGYTEDWDSSRHLTQESHRLPSDVAVDCGVIYVFTLKTLAKEFDASTTAVIGAIKTIANELNLQVSITAADSLQDCLKIYEDKHSDFPLIVIVGPDSNIIEIPTKHTPLLFLVSGDMEKDKIQFLNGIGDIVTTDTMTSNDLFPYFSSLKIENVSL